MRVSPLFDVYASAADLALIDQVARAVRERRLIDVERTLERRVLGPHATRSSRLFDDDGKMTPFVELALHEILAAMRAPSLTPAARRARALDAIEMAGF